MWDKLNILTSAVSSSTITIAFVFSWITAWLLNSLKGMHFDLSALQNMYLAVIVPKVGIHGINSMFNSPAGTPPEGK